MGAASRNVTGIVGDLPARSCGLSMVMDLLHGDCEARIGAGAGCLRNTGANDLSEIAHTIERFDRDCNLGFTASVIA
jgi:hypothetical protein